MIEINADGLVGYLDYMVVVNRRILLAGLFERSAYKAKALGAKFGSTKFSIKPKEFSTKSDIPYHVSYVCLPIGSGRDHFWYTQAVSGEIGNKCFVTTSEDETEDFYNYLMRNYKLPLLKNWTNEILKASMKQGYIKKLYPEIIYGDCPKSILFHKKTVLINHLKFYEVNLDDAKLEQIVSSLLRTKQICITDVPQEPLRFKDFNDYIKHYGASLVKNLEKEITPLCELEGQVKTLALKHKRLYPQQSACVNGILALKKHGVSYGIMNEGMGVGKTLQGMSVVEAYFVADYMKKNPSVSLKDVYLDKSAIHYRTIIMAPGHLIEKWASEISAEIPYAKVTIIRQFSQLLELKARGKKRNGKEYYILSKDFCKLGSQISPIPSKVKKQYVSVPICKDCYNENKQIFYKQGTGKDACCPECKGKNFKSHKINQRKVKGLICPQCGELLTTTDRADTILRAFSENKEDEILLLPKNFSKKSTTNSTCKLCGMNLWGVNAKPIDCGGEFSEWVKRPKKWRKISHFKNKKRKSKETAFVLKHHENEYLNSAGVKPDDFIYLATDYGPRKYAPSTFIKKYLQGFFDFCILDEMHKYEGAGTAQSNAAHALVKASDFTIGLTGTISNGSAGSFFWLFWMLEPGRMKEKGYSYSSSDCMRFCKKYGSIETLYDYNDCTETYNSSSRGRQLTQPRMKPGISPLLFVDFLLDRCVMLDITDLSKYLPPLKEYVVTCELPDNVGWAYRRTIDTLKMAAHGKDGMTALSAMLNVGLSYPDKPYGRNPVMSAFVDDEVVASVENFEEYRQALLPKEQEMVEIINNELLEDRNCFIYATYTGEIEANITNRLKEIVEEHCNLKGRVCILQASSPAALERELYIKKKASEGIKVFITNPKCVETGLDLCFEYDGRTFNYPTLIFMQMSYEMSVIWQASRRHYRLNQRKECRTYYLAYENTLQTAALEIMAEKQVATSAIQGKFSSEGLAAMAKGVDTRTQLATALAKNDMSDRRTLENMFDALNAQNNSSDDSYVEYVPALTFYELTGEQEHIETAEITDLFSFFDTLPKEYNDNKTTQQKSNITIRVTSTKQKNTITETDSFFGDIFEDLFSDFTDDVFEPVLTKPEKKKSTVNKIHFAGQMDFFSVF